MRQRRRGSYRSRYFQYSDVVRRPTIARLFSAPPQAIRSVGGGPPVCTGLTSAQSATGEPSSSFINPYCAQNVKRSPSLNKCARCLAHIPSGGFPPAPPSSRTGREDASHYPLSASLFPGVHKTVVEMREMEENNKRQALFVSVLLLCFFSSSFFSHWRRRRLHCGGGFHVR